MTTLSDMTDNDLLLEVARMKYPGATCTFYPAEYEGEVAGVLVELIGGNYKWLYYDLNAIHPLWAEYAERYVLMRVLHHHKTNSSMIALKNAYHDCFLASLTLRGMLEAVWTVLKEGK